MTTPASAADMVRELVRLGLSKRQIGASVGVNDSYIGRIVTGARGTTGEKYAGRLAQLRADVDARQAAGVPLRRGEVVTTTAPVEKRAQRLRRPTRLYESRRATTARAGKQASQNGARTLVGEVQHAASEGRLVVVDITTTSERLARRATYGRKAEKKKGRTRYFTFTVGPLPAEELLPYIEEAGGSLTFGALTWAVEAGYVEGIEPEDEESIVGVEVRTWDE